MILFLFLCSCSSNGPRWVSQTAQGAHPGYCSSRFVLPPKNDFQGLGVEIVQGSCGMRMYVYIHSLSLPCDRSDPPGTVLYMTAGQEEEEIWTSRLEGGQKLLLPPERAEKILAHLQAGETVVLSTDRYEATLYPSKGPPFRQKTICKKNPSMR